ncbi:MAG: hypothetical protein IPM45_12975 [Acidimicrobiales bacterium]|nr:hypothetical protein [Acidimicrobiales bacterium]
MGPASHRCRRAILASLAVLLFTPACSGSAPGPVVVEATARFVREAAGRTEEARTARFVLTYSFTGVPEVAGGELSFWADGAFDLEHGRGRVNIDLSQIADAAVASGEVPPSAAADLGLVYGQRLETIVDGDTVYQRIPLIGAATGKEWIRVDVAQLGGALPGGADQRATDAAAYLDALDGAGTVTEVGREEVRGVPTTHFAVAIDPQALAGSDDDQASLERILGDEGLESLLASPLPFDTWIDDDGYVRRIAMVVDLSGLALPDVSGQALPAGAVLSFTIEYFDFGAQVDVSPPPGDQVLDVGDLGG